MITEKDVEYLSPRVSVVRKDDRLSIIIRALSDEQKNRWLAIWFTLFTLAGFGFIVSYFMYPHSQQEKVMYMVSIAFWLYFEYVLAKAWRWRRYGFEQINVKDGNLLMKRDVKGRGFVYPYSVRGIRNLGRCVDQTPGWMKIFGGYWDVSGESLSFNYEGQEVRFGSQLDEKEANRLLNVLEKYIPKQKDEEEVEEEKRPVKKSNKKKK